MEYITRNLESDPGLTQTEALVALQQHPTFKDGSIVSGIRKRGSQWVAEVLEPKTAEFPPPKDDGGDEEVAPSKPEGGPPSDSGSPDDGSSDDGGGDSGGPPGDGEKKPEAPKGDEAVLHILTQILHALTGGGAPEGVGGPDALGPGGPGGMAPPPPKAGPPGMGGPPMGGKGPMKGPPPMKPGMTPPGGTPVGAPAFSSVQDEALRQAVASYSGRAATITLTTTGNDIKKAVEEARPVVENFGYKVKQAKQGENGQIHILASRR